MDLIGFVFFSLLPLSSLCMVSAIPSAAPVANNSTCPLDLTYVSRISWNSDTCRNFKPPTEPKTSPKNKTKIPCCQSLMALYRIPLSWNLKATSKFKLLDLPTSTSCLQDYSSKLASYSDSKKLSISDDAVSFCLDPLQFILSPNTCAHINSSQDWVNQLGLTTALDSSCRPDLINIADCERCIPAMVKVQAELASRNDNTSHSRDCWLLTILYAAGIVNQLGPESDGVVSCILSADFKLDSPSKKQVDSPKSKKHTVALVGAIIPTTLLTLFAAASFYYWRRKKGDRTNIGGNKDAVFLHDTEKQIADFIRSGQFREDEKKDIDVPFVVLESIRVATDNFSEENKLGKGGFGTVYKGKFPRGQEIAIKRLSSGSGQGFQEFKNEVLLIAKLQHRNLVRLLGYCVEAEEKMLLYEYMPNKSLDSFIFDRKLCELLNWETRFNIILGIARGLLYLHHDSRLRIIHRDLKTGNVLLDKDMNPKISDFGLARIFGGKQTEGRTTRVVGTYGYMPPEYAVHGFFSIKSDVFSFGVMVLEIVSGEKNTGFYQTKLAMTLLGYAWKLWKQNKPLDLMDATLSKTCNANEFLKCVNIGLLCVQQDPSDRPTMSNVVYMLESETMILPSPKQPAFVAFDSISNSGSSSKQLSVNEMTNTLEQGR